MIVLWARPRVERSKEDTALHPTPVTWSALSPALPRAVPAVRGRAADHSALRCLLPLSCVRNARTPGFEDLYRDTVAPFDESGAGQLRN